MTASPANDELFERLCKELERCDYIYHGCEGCRYLVNCVAAFDAGVSSYVDVFSRGYRMTDERYQKIKLDLARVGCLV